MRDFDSSYQYLISLINSYVYNDNHNFRYIHDNVKLFHYLHVTTLWIYEFI